MEENILHKVVSRFCIEGDIVDIAPLGGGLINDTYRVCTAGPCPDYVLQRINNSIFKDVDLLQSNIDAVTGHIRSKLTLSGVGDESDLSKVSFRMDIFESFARGYLESTSSFLTDIERNNLAFGVLLFPFMQAFRFFTDYLNGDVYYKISYPEHNLVRTRNQVTFFRKARENYERMADIIEKFK